MRVERRLGLGESSLLGGNRGSEPSEEEGSESLLSRKVFGLLEVDEGDDTDDEDDEEEEDDEELEVSQLSEDEEEVLRLSF